MCSVADRFHLVLNLSSAIERVLEERSRDLVLPPDTPLTPPEAPIPNAARPAPPSANQILQLQRRQRRFDRYQEVIELHHQGHSQKAINVLANNRDDHAKNFSFLLDARNKWVLSPAYDLVFSMVPPEMGAAVGHGLPTPRIEHPETDVKCQIKWF